MKKSMITSIFVMTLLLLLIIQPVVFAQSTEYETITASWIRIPYGTGTDTDGDGVIDNWGELGVEYGTEEMNFTKVLIDGWYDGFTFYGSTVLNKRDFGVQVAGIHEQLWMIESSSNESITPTAACYTHNNTETKGVSDVLNVATFYVKLGADTIMTGAQEFWYRSPLAWEDDVYEETAHVSKPIMIPEHYLNIYDEDNVLVWASPEPSVFEGNPYPRNIADNSTDGTTFERLYYKITMAMRPGIKYRFEEYVKTIDDNPVNSVKLYMSRFQDIANDGYTDTIIFKQSPYSRLIPVECSWGALFTIGLGLSGTEKPIYSGPGGSEKPIISTTTPIVGTDAIGDVDSIRIIIPLRTTKALEIDVRVTVETTAGSWTSGWKNYEDIVGTAILDFEITDPGPAVKNEYTFEIRIENFNTGAGHALTYVMYEAPGVFHIVENNGGQENSVEYCFFAPLIEIEEYAAAPGGEEHIGSTDPNFLVGSLLQLLGGLLIAAALFIPGLNAIVMASGVVLGTVTFFTGLYIAFPEETVAFLDAIRSGLLRVGRIIYEGINEITGGLLDVLVQVVETVVNLGSWVLHNAGLILLAIVDIIYFITAFIVWWLTAKFLSIMTSIRRGDIEKAGRTIVQVESVVRRRIRQVTRPVKKVVRYAKGGK